MPGPYGPPSQTPPTMPPSGSGSTIPWWKKLQEKWKNTSELGTPSGLGGGNAITPVPQSVTQYNQPATYPITSTGTIGVAGTANPQASSSPYWQQYRNYHMREEDYDTYRHYINGWKGGRDMSAGGAPVPDYGSGGSGGYKPWKKKKGGGWGPGFYSDVQLDEPFRQYTNAPAWARGLASWEIG